ncbi:MAG: Ig-like domain-containing protein [Bacillota bacterium]|nr:Ig-like domain-containing protein [Bacillota bacterium]
MNCKEVKDLLEEYITGDIDESKISAFEEHISKCSNCKNELDELNKSIYHIKKAFKSLKIPDNLDEITIINKKKKIYPLNRIFGAAAACFVAVLFMAIIALNFLPMGQVNADDYRDGYSLKPLLSDSTGVNPESGFLLKSSEDISLSKLEGIISIEGEPAPVVSQNGTKTFNIKPARILEQNKLYTFKIKSVDNKEITWTYQTSAAFKILSVFPADRTVEVPVNTGIEIYFNNEDYEDLSAYFDISPKVQGRFERHKTVMVFVPDELKEGTLYTVKIKKGLKVKGSTYRLNDDYVFKFETGAKEDKPLYGKGSINYSRLVNEFTPRDKPQIPINYMVNDLAAKSTVKNSIYILKNVDQFIQLLRKKESVPDWAVRSQNANFIETNGLQRVCQFSQDLSGHDATRDGYQFIRAPEPLKKGFYLVDSKWEDVRFQTFLQVTDIGVYVMQGGEKSILWVNDLDTKNPIQNAIISCVGENGRYYSDNQGIATITSVANEKDSNNSNGNKLIKISVNDEKDCIIVERTNDYYRDLNSYASRYWNFLQLDRNIYKPDDTVNFWGIVKDRYSKNETGELTIDIEQGQDYQYGYNRGVNINDFSVFHYNPMDKLPLVSKKVKTDNGAFKDSFKLPMLDPGGYQLNLKKGDEIVSRTYINIQNYVKPSYKLDITKDKQAVFQGQQVTFKVNASFFEGTGLPSLPVNYDINSSSIGSAEISGTKETDQKGNFEVNFIPKPGNGVQGEQYVNMNCNATLPETGAINSNLCVRVFTNDINVNLAGSIKGSRGKISAKVNKITLDRLNNNSAKDDSDYIGEPADGKTLKAAVYKNTWVRIEEGTYYDFINKVIEKNYRYEPKKELIQEYSLTTDSNGIGVCEFDTPKSKDCSYSAEVTCKDDSGRDMKFSVYLEGDEASLNDTYYDNRYVLDGGKENYSLNDTVDLTFKKGKNTMPDGRYLFIKTQNGIRDYSVKNSPNFSFSFSEKDAPNVFVTGVYFNGYTYVESEQFNAVYMFKEKEMELTAHTDKNSYKPGDEVTIDISARDRKGQAKNAIVNISLVDEALFKLSEQSINTISSLYQGVLSGVDFTYASHVNNAISSMPVITYGNNIQVQFSEAVVENGTRAATDWSISSGYHVDIKYDKAICATATCAYDTTNIRQVFKDAAVFENIRLDENGKGSLKFKLPDNITSWRVTMSGITSDLSAGSGKVALNVSLPFFINYALNSTFLSGDKPVLGVNAYGNELEEGDDVIFTVTSENDPNKTVSVKGKAFERVNIPLWEFKEGSDKLLITANSSGMKDSIMVPIKTLNTYQELQKAKYYEHAQKGMKIEAGKAGNTELVFSDASRGKYLNQLIDLQYQGGRRVDQRLSSKIACELMNKYFKGIDVYDEDQSFKITDYQKADGGIALYTYGNSDADLSARMISLVKNDVNLQKLKAYFYNILLGDSNGVKGNALYALAVLREPVLLNLDKAANVENASIKDLIYVALAYCELGETGKAENIFNQKISSHIESRQPFYRVRTGNDGDDILECTSLAAILASKLDKPQKNGLYEYCINSHTKDILINIEKLIYISSEIEKANDENVKIKYSYEGKQVNKVLEKGEVFSVTIPSENILKFNVESVEGDITLVSIFRTSLNSEQRNDNDLKIERSYYVGNNKTNRFKAGDLVKIEITWNIPKDAIDGEYEITDFLPSGLKPIEGGYSTGHENTGAYASFDGQKARFYVNKDDDPEKIEYYARIVNTGEFKAEGAVIQGLKSKASINIGKNEKIIID